MLSICNAKLVETSPSGYYYPPRLLNEAPFSVGIQQPGQMAAVRVQEGCCTLAGPAQAWGIRGLGEEAVLCTSRAHGAAPAQAGLSCLSCVKRRALHTASSCPSSNARASPETSLLIFPTMLQALSIALVT